MKNKNIIAAVIAFCLCACAMPVNILAANEKIEESTEKSNYSIGEIGGYLEGSIKTVRQMENERLFQTLRDTVLQQNRQITLLTDCTAKMQL